jgi:hypothetical protein
MGGRQDKRRQDKHRGAFVISTLAQSVPELVAAGPPHDARNTPKSGYQQFAHLSLGHFIMSASGRMTRRLLSPSAAVVVQQTAGYGTTGVQNPTPPRRGVPEACLGRRIS